METPMKLSRSFSVVLSLMICASAGAQSNQAGSAGIEALPRDVEIELAASALPKHVGATDA
jgi:hypothetical protein